MAKLLGTMVIMALGFGAIRLGLNSLVDRHRHLERLHHSKMEVTEIREGYFIDEYGRNFDHSAVLEHTLDGWKTETWEAGLESIDETYVGFTDAHYASPTATGPAYEDSFTDLWGRTTIELSIGGILLLASMALWHKTLNPNQTIQRIRARLVVWRINTGPLDPLL